MSGPPAAAVSRRRAGRWILATLVAGAVVGVVVLALRARQPPPPVLGTVPDFALIERSGRLVTPGDLQGQPYVASFIFTRCTGTCPALSARMAEIRRAAASAGLPVRFVSFSVDPVHDRPEVLREYASRTGADHDDWFFLTGDRDALYTLIGAGFRLAVAERPAADVASRGGELIAHSDRLVLVDGQGQIRGYYRGIEPETTARLLADLAALGEG